VHVGEDVSGSDDVPTLRVTDDADRMVDGVLLRAAPRAQLESGVPDGERPEANDYAVVGRNHLPHDRSRGEHRRIGIASLCANPALVRGRGRAVLDGVLR
jgi:hypothetical protein